MKSAVYRKYGGPDVLFIENTEKPVPKDNELLIRVRASSVTTVDVVFRNGSQIAARGFTGMTKPKFPVLGSEFSGEVESVGKNVGGYKPGDEVFASTEGYGSYAEYVCLADSAALYLKPKNLSFGEAAVVPAGALTALPFLRDVAKIKAGTKILIIGASGSVGSYAVQLGKYFQAEVTGVCGSANVEVVRSLGADTVIDYTKEDFTRLEKTYDVVFDSIGKSSFSACKRILNDGGMYLTTVISTSIFFHMLLTSMAGKRKAIISFTGMRPKNDKIDDLKFIKELIETGRLKPLIDREFPLEHIGEAHAYVEKGHKKGNVVVTINGDGVH